MIAHLEEIDKDQAETDLADNAVQDTDRKSQLDETAAGNHGLESADHLVDEVEEDNGGQQRKRNGKESAHRAGAVHDGGFIIA